MTSMLSIVAIFVSMISLLVLGLRDPKRLRTQSKHLQQSMEPLPIGARRVLTAIALAPGLLLAFFGFWQPFLVWLGATCTLAWLAVQLFSKGERHTSS